MLFPKLYPLRVVQGLKGSWMGAGVDTVSCKWTDAFDGVVNLEKASELSPILL